MRHSVSTDLTALPPAGVLRMIFACWNFSLSHVMVTSSGLTDLLKPPNEYMPFFAVCVTYLMPPLICAVTFASTMGLPAASLTKPKKRTPSSLCFASPISPAPRAAGAANAQASAQIRIVFELDIRPPDSNRSAQKISAQEIRKKNQHAQQHHPRPSRSDALRVARRHEPGEETRADGGDARGRHPAEPVH